MPILTIYTPTYNRCKLLPRLYMSLCKQTCIDFLWLIVDDGSTDNTHDLVRVWAENSCFQVKYVYKENGGVHTARDLAYELADTELIWGVDSDDWLVENAVEKVVSLWTRRQNESYLGVLAPVKDIDGKHKMVSYPALQSASFQDILYKYGCRGDQTIIVRSDVVKKIPRFPRFSNEKLVSEGFKWIQLPDKPFLLLKDFTTFVEYQNTGYSQNVRRGYFKNLHGYYENHKIHIKYSKYVSKKIEYCIKFIVTGFYLKKKNIISDSYYPPMTLLLYPLGFLVFIYTYFKWKKFR